MGANQTILIAFGSISFLVVALGLAVRDLLSPRRPSDSSLPAGRRGSIRRQKTVFDQKPATTFFGKVDQGFDRLVLEADSVDSPQAAFLLILLSGLLVGGGLWMYSNEVLAAIAGGLLGMMLPLITFSIQRTRRFREIREQMPHVLDMLSRACRAGQNSEQAIQLVGDEMDGAIGREFRRCGRELELGRSFGEVMRSLGNRVRTMDMRILTTTLVVQRRTGGSLPDTLERMSGVVRDRINAQRQMRASTGAGRASTMLVTMIAPLAYLFMFVFHREHLANLYQDPIGRVMLVMAVILEIIGIVWVMTLLRQVD
ncbi:type II secretion system F family protein [Thalassoroseus pseudoceratinae]|uniref:type II secretion system F family protein n=1 Tax=Thalassoroseus pseudoceratinae TaxID=2713176 RepID=UPI0014240751|nr:type II secretion system F family protein [Thalassoroseus pseudoceratinae]